MSMKLYEMWVRREAAEKAYAALTGGRYVHKPRWMERAYRSEGAPDGVRIVGWVTPEFSPWRNWLIAPDAEPLGWYDNDHGESWKDGTGLVTGVVGQLPGRGGRARFIAGYKHGGDWSWVQWDTTKIFVDREPGGYAQREDRQHSNACRACGRYADQLAERAAEEEREYRREQDEDDAA